MEFIAMLALFILAIFLGFELITKVPPTLHTPLMSGSNAISGITIVGALLAAGADDGSTLTTVLGTTAVALATINVIGGYLVTEGDLPLGDFVAFFMFLNMVVGPFRVAGFIINLFQRAAVASNRLFEVFDLQPEIPDRPNNATPKQITGWIELKQINYRYPGSQTTVIKNVSLSIKTGETIAIMGRVGAGKTTLLKAIIGAQKYVHGELTLDGIPLQDLSQVERAKTLSYLPQAQSIEWQLQVRALVMLGRFPYQRAFSPPSPDCEYAVDQALATVNATPFALRSLHTLSGGERALVLLARTLAVGAPLILVDEPIAELDLYHQINVMQILKDKATEGVGVLAVLHDLTMAAQFMDRLILINDGSVFAEGSPKEVLTKKNLEEVYKISPRQKDLSNNSIIFPWQKANKDV